MKSSLFGISMIGRPVTSLGVRQIFKKCLIQILNLKFTREIRKLLRR